MELSKEEKRKIYLITWRKNNPNYQANYRAANRDKFKEYNKKWKESNPNYTYKPTLEQSRKYSKKWKSKNPEKVLQMNRDYRANMPIETKNKIAQKSQLRKAKKKDIIKQYNKCYRENNPERVKELGKNYNLKNRDKINFRAREKRKSDTTARLIHNIRSYIPKAIKLSLKSGKTFDLIGCDCITLKSHIEHQFTEGMSWDNYGKNGWHIDHIVPCSLFDLSFPEQQLSCFNFKNLQPLWRSDNLLKSNKLEVCPI